MSDPTQLHGRRSFFLASAGLAWAVALLPAAFLVPVYRGEASSSAGTVATSNTEVGVNGLWAVWLLCIPLFLALTAWVGLRFLCSRGSTWARGLAWLSVVLLWAFALVGAASVGLFVIPTALLLTVAATHTPTPSVRPSAS